MKLFGYFMMLSSLVGFIYYLMSTIIQGLEKGVWNFDPIMLSVLFLVPTGWIITKIDMSPYYPEPLSRYTPAKRSETPISGFLDNRNLEQEVEPDHGFPTVSELKSLIDKTFLNEQGEDFISISVKNARECIFQAKRRGQNIWMIDIPLNHHSHGENQIQREVYHDEVKRLFSEFYSEGKLYELIWLGEPDTVKDYLDKILL